MTAIDAREIPVDPESATRLAERGLDYRLIDTASEKDAEAFLRADARGFLGADPSAEAVAADRIAISDRRNIGVFAQGAEIGTYPVATVNSWVTPLTVPGGEVDMWAISSVTVAGTHRRNGIARALLEGELRAAASAGVAIAGLTVSEATIYGRYGFAPALPMSRITIDTRRAGWRGPGGAGRLEYIDRETLQQSLSTLHEVARTQRAGDIAGWDSRWAGVAGLSAGHPSPKEIRGVRYHDEGGNVRGVMAFKLTEIAGSFRFELEIRHVSAVTADALRALWGFALQHDLVDKVTADLRPIDDPLPWLVVDPRGVEVVVHDHGWLRILDVPAALGARRYRKPLDLVLAVDDPLGIATGAWRVTVDADGAATVVEAEPDVETVGVITVDVATLSALLLGGVSAAQLVAAGRLQASAADAVAIDDAFRADAAPALSIWY